MTAQIDRIGPAQVRLLQVLKMDGAALYQESGRWYLLFERISPNRNYQSRERCMALYTRGFLMADATTGGRTRYVLTTKGEFA